MQAGRKYCRAGGRLVSTSVPPSIVTPTQGLIDGHLRQLEVQCRVGDWGGTGWEWGSWFMRLLRYLPILESLCLELLNLGGWDDA